MARARIPARTRRLVEKQMDALGQAALLALIVMPSKQFSSRLYNDTVENLRIVRKQRLAGQYEPPHGVTAVHSNGFDHDKKNTNGIHNNRRSVSGLDRFADPLCGVEPEQP